MRSLFTKRAEDGSAGSTEPAAAADRGRRRGPIVAAGLVAVVILAVVGLLAGNVLSIAGARSTPEAAVNQYLEAVAAGDTAKLQRACAIEEASTRFRFDLNADWIKAITPTTNLFPTNYRFYSEMNRSLESAGIFNQVRGLEYSLLQSEPPDKVIVPADAVRAQQYVKDVDPSRLADMKVVSVRSPRAAMANDAKNLSNMATRAKIYGADEMTERLALVAWNGKHYQVGFTLLRYGGDWKVLSQSSGLAGTSASGTADPTTPEAFDKATSGS